MRIVLIAVEALITILRLIPFFLWLLLSVYFTNLKIERNRKKMVKMLRREGLSEYASIKIAEYVFPKLELSKLMSIMRMSRNQRREEEAGWRAE